MVDVSDLHRKPLESLEQLKQLTQIFDDHGIYYWLDSGTLLGIIREDRILPSDCDIDIGVWSESGESLKTLVRKVAKMGYSISASRYKGEVSTYYLIPKQNLGVHARAIDLKLWRQCGGFAWCPSVSLVNRFDTNPWAFQLWRLMRGVVWRIWMYFLPGIPPQSWPLKVFVDVYCWWTPISYFQNIVRLDNGLCVPREYEKYLQYRYGEWRIPVEDWDYKTDDPTYMWMSPEDLCASVD